MADECLDCQELQTRIDTLEEEKATLSDEVERLRSLIIKLQSIIDKEF